MPSNLAAHYTPREMKKVRNPFTAVRLVAVYLPGGTAD